MNKKKMAVIMATVSLFVVAAMNADGRTQYKKVVDKMDAQTPAETELQAQVVANKCNACHVDGQEKKVRNDYGKLLRTALGGDDYKFDKKAWKKNKDTKAYPADMVKKLRDAINAVE